MPCVKPVALVTGGAKWNWPRYWAQFAGHAAA